MVLQLFGVEGLGLGWLGLRGVGDEVEVHVGSLVHVGENEGGADGGFCVEA